MTSKEFDDAWNYCEKMDATKRSVAEVMFNTGYLLGRRRWYWGPSWWVSFIGWLNTQRSKLTFK